MLSAVAMERYEKSDAHLGFNYTSSMYKLHYQPYELNKMDQIIIVITSLILGSAGFVYSAMPNPLQQTALNGGKNHKTSSRLLRLWP